MDWIKELTDHFDTPEFFPPVKEKDLRAIEKKLSVKFNKELRSLFKITDGFLANLDANICWSILEEENNTGIFSENTYLHQSNDAPAGVDFKTIIFFGDDGADTFWGYKIEEGKMTDTLVAWNRMKNSIREYQMPLRNFFRMVAES